MLKDNQEFKEHLESVLKSWKDSNKITFPFFYNIDYKKNRLVLYSHKPGVLIGYDGETIHDLDVCFQVGNIRFKGVDVKVFTGGVIY